MDSPERSKLRLSPSADCSSSPPFWSPPLPTPSVVASAALADPSVASAVDPVGRRPRRPRRPCRLCRCPPGHQATVASATLVYALSLSDAAAQGRPPSSSTTGPPAASPTSPSIAAAAPPDPTVPAAPTVPAGIALASIGASAATGATASAAAGAPAAAAPAAAPMSSSLSSEVS
ncbi:hypothetical protein PVAP13_3NG181249 [Panicum virgatum]|uniref:Uncharacterized protein n=1 Tax=Panicum virgatum TaxID=38727 RepID=A0A8T0U9T9_PANVG|nr:hypothetical protein PVAP13_3NG181249 [Panicum virgatum]